MKNYILYSTLLAIATLVTPSQLQADTTHTISISSQEDFDRLSEHLCSILENGGDQNIRVSFSQGIYSFHEDHINIKNVIAPNTSISFEGNGSIIMADGKDYANGDHFYDDVTPTESFATQDGQDFNTWSKIQRTSNHVIEMLDNDNGACRLNVSDIESLTDKTEEECSTMYIWIPQWYTSRIYKVDSIQSKYIYFTISPSDNINGDTSYGKISQLRFRLSNNPDIRGDILISNGHIYIPEGVNTVRHTKTTRLMNLYNNKFKGISINGLKIYGNGKQNNNTESPLINKHLLDIRYTKCNTINVTHCDFRSLQVTAICVNSTNNVSIEGCNFEDCYSYCIYQDRSSRVLSVHDCTFHNVNKRINNTNAISCRGGQFRVSDNVISDFGYNAILAGIWHGHNDVTMNCYGVIENNEIYYTQPYFEEADEHNLMDSGAIYLSAISNGITIRYNNIHHYAGAKSNRGIFCDDGAKNFQIYGNTITNVTNSYSIDSRRVSLYDSKFGGLNINNVIRDNIVDRPIRFQGNEMNHNGCIYEGNIHLDGNDANDKISNVNQFQ